MTDLPIPRKHASDLLYSTGPALNFPTKTDPGAALAATGIIPGVGYGAQSLNYTLNGHSRIARRQLTLMALKLHILENDGITPSDLSDSLGVVQTNTEEVLLVKGDANGVLRYTDLPVPELSGVTVAALTTNVRKVIGNAVVGSASRFLAIGSGGSDNAFTTNNGNAWTAGGATGMAAPIDGVWDGVQFVLTSVIGESVHSTNGVAWTAATGGSEIYDTLTGAQGDGLAVLSGVVYAAGAITNPAFVRSTNPGATWANTGGTIPSAGNYVAFRGWLAGNGGTEIYWLGFPSSVSSSRLDFFASPDGITWTLRSQITGLTLGAGTPKLLVCQSTGMLVAIMEQSFGGFTVHASFDKGFTWTERMYLNIASIHALGVAHGRLWCAVGNQLFASAGIGDDL